MRMADYKCLKQQIYTDGTYSLVPIRNEDRWDIMKWRNEQIYHLRQSRPLTCDDQELYFTSIVSKLFDQERPNQILFSFLKEESCIGYGGLVHINWIDNNAEISFIMDTTLEKGHFAELWDKYLHLLKDVAFEDLNLHKIYTYAFDLRPHLYPILESNGFIREATLKDHCHFQGEYKDVVIHSLWNKKFTVINYTDCSITQQREILALRNLDSIRKWMVNPEIITEENHMRFIESLKNSPVRKYFAIYKDDSLLGTYNLTKEEDGIWERGILANPTYQGSGETAKWERYILTKLPSLGIHAVTAKVRIDNFRSLRYHEKLGYLEKSRDNQYVYFILHLQ